MKQLIDAGGKETSVVSALIERLFPAAERCLPRGSHYEAIWLGVVCRRAEGYVTSPPELAPGRLLP